MPGRDHLTFGVVEVFHGVADDKRQRIGVSERVPDDVEPVAVAELSRLVPLVRRQADGMAAGPAFGLDPPDAPHRVAESGLRVGWPQAANIETDLQVADTLALPA